MLIAKERFDAVQDAGSSGLLAGGIDEERAVRGKEVRYGPDLRCYDWESHRLGFYDADAEALPFGGGDENVGEGKQGGHVESVHPA